MKSIDTTNIRFIGSENDPNEVVGIDFGDPIRMVSFDKPLTNEQVIEMVEVISNVYGYSCELQRTPRAMRKDDFYDLNRMNFAIREMVEDYLAGRAPIGSAPPTPESIGYLIDLLAHRLEVIGLTLREKREEQGNET